MIVNDNASTGLFYYSDLGVSFEFCVAIERASCVQNFDPGIYE